MQYIYMILIGQSISSTVCACMSDGVKACTAAHNKSNFHTSEGPINADIHTACCLSFLCLFLEKAWHIIIDKIPNKILHVLLQSGSIKDSEC